jgi:hypothetical protein
MWDRSGEMTGFAARKRQLSPVAQAMTVAQLIAFWARDFNDLQAESGH